MSGKELGVKDKTVNQRHKNKPALLRLIEQLSFQCTSSEWSIDLIIRQVKIIKIKMHLHIFPPFTL